MKSRRRSFSQSVAKASGINKSLLQHCFTQKIEIVKTMPGELLETSSAYMATLSFRDEELFQSISDFNMLFFKGVANDYNLRQFLLSSVMQAECLDAWVDTICSWLKRYCGENTFTFRQLKTAMIFAMGGTMHLFVHQDELDIRYRGFCGIHIRAILSLLNYAPIRIERVIAIGDSIGAAECAFEYGIPSAMTGGMIAANVIAQCAAKYMMEVLHLDLGGNKSNQ